MNQAAKDLGAVTVEEQSREILTASSNMLEASKETTSPFIEEGNFEPLAINRPKKIQPLDQIFEQSLQRNR